MHVVKLVNKISPCALLLVRCAIRLIFYFITQVAMYTLRPTLSTYQFGWDSKQVVMCKMSFIIYEMCSFMCNISPSCARIHL